MHVSFYSIRWVHFCKLQISGGDWMFAVKLTLWTVQYSADWSIWFITTDISMVTYFQHSVEQLNLAEAMHCIQAECLCGSVGVCLRGWQMIRRCEGTAVRSLGPLGNCLLLSVLSAHLLKPPSASLSLFTFFLFVQDSNWNASPVRGELGCLYYNANSLDVSCHHHRFWWTKFSISVAVGEFLGCFFFQIPMFQAFLLKQHTVTFAEQ